MAKLLKDPKSRLIYIKLCAASKTDGPTSVATFASDEALDSTVRIEAIRTLGILGRDYNLKSLIELYQPKNPLALECIKPIGLILPTGGKVEGPGKDAIEFLQKILLDDQASDDQRIEAIRALTGNRAGTQWLLDALQKDELLS